MHRAFVLCSLIYDGLRRTLFLRLLRRHTDIKLPRRDHASVLLHGWSRPVVYDVSCVRALLFDLRRPSANAEFCSHAFAWRSCKWLRPLRILESHAPPPARHSLSSGVCTHGPQAQLFDNPLEDPGTFPEQSQNPPPFFLHLPPAVPVSRCPGVFFICPLVSRCPGGNSCSTWTLWLRDASVSRCLNWDSLAPRCERRAARLVRLCGTIVLTSH